METKLKTFGNLVPGDRIVGSDGQTVTVTDVYEKHFPDTMYEIEMEDGEVVQASGNHLWYCETDIDVRNKDEYMRLAKNYFANNGLPSKLNKDKHYPLEEMILKFGDSIETQLFIEKACKSLGYSSYTPHIVIEDFKRFAGQAEVHNYSFNDLIEFLQKMKDVISGKGYFYFGEVRTTEEISELMVKGVRINIPHNKDIIS